MRIDHIAIDNYRRFEHFECDFDSHFTLLIGANGSGKTSLLRAVFDGLGAVVGNSISDVDVRRQISVDPGDSAWRQAMYPCSIRVKLHMNDEALSLTQERTAHGNLQWSPNPVVDQSAVAGFGRIQSLLPKWLDPGETLPVPVIARFGANSSFSGSGEPHQVRAPFQSKGEAWQRANSESVNIQALAQWFQYNELRTLQEQQTPLAFRVARQAVLSAIHATDVKYVVRDNQLMLNHIGEGWRPWDQLSDGQKRIAAIFCELALRCATLNSHMAEHCIDESPGIILIDELDLHLHPAWQRSVIGDLRRVFPNLQFIAASHSPFLLQAAFEHGKVIDMRTGEFALAGDLSIEDLTENLMGVPQPQRGQHFLKLKQLAADYMRKLESPPTDPDSLNRLKSELDGAMAVFANDPASAAWLEQQRAAAGL